MQLPRARLLSLAACLGLAAPLSAQVLRVQAGAPGGDGSSWSNAFGDLQLALAAAAADPGVRELWVAAGTYRPASSSRSASFVVPSGVALYGGFAGNELVRDARDPHVHVAILDGDLNGDDQPGLVNYGDNSWHVVTAVGVVSLVLDGFTVRGGSEGGGAGIRASAEQVELANLVVKENHGLGNNNDGAGAWLAANFVDVRGSAFLDNRTTSGGGLQLVDPPLPGAKLATFVDCVFERNQATDGAGIRATGVEPWSLTLERCTFRAGYGTSGAGVTLYSEGVSSLEARASVFEDNAACAGGALYLVRALARIEDCRFRGNGARGGCGFGAGGGAVKGVDTTLDVLGSTFQDDRRSALWIEGASSAAVALSSLVSASGAAIRVQGGSLQLEGCIVWGATSPQVTFGPGGSAGASFSDVRMGGPPLPGSGNLELDPLFADLAAGLHLAAGSPCIDAGDPALSQPGADFERDSRMLDGDLDGTPRIDMGADEFGPAHLAVLGIPAPGNTLTFVTSGPPGLTAVLFFGRPDVRHFPQVGSLFVDLSASRAFAWPSAPSSVPVLVPPGVSGVFHAQEVLLGGGAAVLSNYEPLQF